jgi:hypothetical protein
VVEVGRYGPSTDQDAYDLERRGLRWAISQAIPSIPLPITSTPMITSARLRGKGSSHPGLAGARCGSGRRSILVALAEVDLACGSRLGVWKSSKALARAMPPSVWRSSGSSVRLPAKLTCAPGMLEAPAAWAARRPVPGVSQGRDLAGAEQDPERAEVTAYQDDVWLGRAIVPVEWF